MAASITDLASRFGSVGFLAGRFFFGFGIGLSCHIHFRLSAPEDFKSYQYPSRLPLRATRADSKRANAKR